MHRGSELRHFRVSQVGFRVFLGRVSVLVDSRYLWVFGHPRYRVSFEYRILFGSSGGSATDLSLRHSDVERVAEVRYTIKPSPRCGTRARHDSPSYPSCPSDHLRAGFCCSGTRRLLLTAALGRLTFVSLYGTYMGLIGRQKFPCLHQPHMSMSRACARPPAHSPTACEQLLD